ncbi:phospholipase A [Alkalilimnicola ehrlichii]|nr:phospholipase A [Alkalilimnicola ehrlichii]
MSALMLRPARLGLCCGLLLICTPLAHASSAEHRTRDNSDVPPTVREQLANNEEPALTVHEPMYFLVGGHSGDDLTARIQLSFKYRLFDPEMVDGNGFAWLTNVHFAYTQESLWDLSEDSYPFRDTVHRPSIFWERARITDKNQANILRVGLEHESNGEDEEASRSIDTLFIQPGFATDVFERELILAPKFYAYLVTGSHNRDVDRYRGYGDFVVRYGNDDSWVAQVAYRYGIGGNHTGQLDVSIPIRPRIFGRTGAYIYFQVFEGYGETLLDYNRRTPLTARVGFAIVR